ncbi:hypothetical protein QF004_002298 [Chryseobacterium sp. MDT2-18]|nr:hypothetical protein [Chryseobacterium sp. MDT2-18]
MEVARSKQAGVELQIVQYQMNSVFVILIYEKISIW